MKKSRLVALATASAVALSSVVPAHAAQVGPLDQNKCKVTFTAAEKADLKRIETALDSFPTWKSYRDIALAIEQAYNVRGYGDNFVAVHKNELSGYTSEAAFDAAYRNLDTKYHRSLLAMAGMTDELAQSYLKARAKAEYGQSFVHQQTKTSAIEDSMEVEARSVDAVPDEEQDANYVVILFTLLYGFGGTLGNSANMQSFYKALAKTETGAVLRNYDPFFTFYAQAGDACLRGGNTSMTWLKNTEKPAPKPNIQPSTGDSTQSKPNTDTKPSTGDHAAKEQGSSTAGIIFGVIAALLAVIGLVVVAAPQLGIQIPGLN